MPGCSRWSTSCRMQTDRGCGGRRAVTSFLQRLPFARRGFRNLLPLFPRAIESLDVSAFDLVISSSHAVAKGVRTHRGQLHVCYCYTPMRYAWDLREQYLRQPGIDRGPARLARPPHARQGPGMGPRGKRTRRPFHRDLAAHRRAHPALLRARIDRHLPAGGDRSDCSDRGDRPAAWPRIGLRDRFAARPLQAGRPDRRGVPAPARPRAGGDRRRPRARAGSRRSRVRTCACSAAWPTANAITGSRSARAFVFAAEEDFGIAPLEAQAAGTPVIALARGGALETIRGLEARGADGRAVRRPDGRCHRRRGARVRGQPGADRIPGLRRRTPAASSRSDFAASWPRSSTHAGPNSPVGRPRNEPQPAQGELDAARCGVAGLRSAAGRRHRGRRVPDLPRQRFHSVPLPRFHGDGGAALARGAACAGPLPVAARRELRRRGAQRCSSPGC